MCQRFQEKQCKVWEFKWEYHNPWHPQSSGKVERMNGEIKKQLTKLMLETRTSWIRCLPLALLNIRTKPRTDIGLSPFEMLYGMPYDLEIPADHPQLQDVQLKPKGVTKKGPGCTTPSFGYGNT